MKDFEPRELAILAWAMRCVGHHDVALCEAMNQHALHNLDSFGAAELGLLLQGLSRFKACSKPLLEAVAVGIAAEDAVSLPAQDAARILSSFVIMGHRGEHVQQMAERIAAAMSKRLYSAIVRQVVTIITCLAKLGANNAELREQLAEIIAQQVEAFSHGQLAAILAVYIEADHIHEQLFQAANRSLAEMGAAPASSLHDAAAAEQQQQPQAPDHEQPRGVGDQSTQPSADSRPIQSPLSDSISLAGYLAAARRLRPTGAAAVAAQALQAVDKVKPRDLAILLNALSSRGDLSSEQSVQDLFTAAIPCIKLHMAELSPFAVCNLALAFARLKERTQLEVEDQLLLSLFDRAVMLLGQLDQKKAVDLHEAMVRSGVVHQGLQGKLAEFAAARKFELQGPL